MASANPGGGAGDGSGDGDGFNPPKTPRFVLKDSGDSEELSPDTVENVADETDSVFRTFVHQMLNNERDNQNPDDTPSLPELTAFPSNPLS